jgi:hypothetical protein
MDIRNGLITTYNGINASLGTSNQFNINKSGTNYLNVFNNGRVWIGSGTPVDAGYQVDIAGVLRGTNTTANSDVMIFQGAYNTLAFQSRLSNTTSTSWIRLISSINQVIANIHIGGGVNTISSSAANEQRNVLIAPLFNNTMATQGNTVVGFQAGLNLTVGSYNTLLGHNAGNNLTNGNNNVVISAGGGGGSVGSVSSSNSIIIGSNANGSGDYNFIIGAGTGVYPANFSFNNKVVFIGESTNSPGANSTFYPQGVMNYTQDNLDFYLIAKSAYFSSLSNQSRDRGAAVQILGGARSLNATNINHGGVKLGYITTASLSGSSAVIVAEVEHLTGSGTAGIFRINSGHQLVVGTSITPTASIEMFVLGDTVLSGSVTVSGSMLMSPSSSFVLPLTASSSPLTGSAYWSGSLLFIWNGTRYMSSSFA